jgi:hypothetical protein
MNYRLSASIFFILACLAGCGGGGSSSTGSSGGSSSSSSSSVSIPPPAPATLGRIVLNSALLRAIPSTIDTLVFRGLDSQGTQTYGPVSQAKAATIVLENVPVAVRTLEIDYLQSGVVRGRASQAVQVVAGKDTQISNPNFNDVTYALTQIRLNATSLEMRRGQTAPLRAQGTYADNSSADLSDSVEWTSSNTSVAENIAGTVVARGVGNCTLTATVGSLSSQASVQVNRPLLHELQISPANATLLEGGQVTYEAVGIFEDGSQEAVGNVAWSSNPDSVASISPQGQAQARTPGECLIQATSDGVTSNTTLTVAVNETLTNLVLNPPQLQVPKGMTFGFAASASYANGTSTDVTLSTTYESEDETVAQAGEGGFSSPALPLLVFYSRDPWLADNPPPYFPLSPYHVRAVSQGMTRVLARFEALVAEAWITVVNPVPFEARVQPVQTHVLEVGGQLQLETLTGLTDGTQEIDRSDIAISQNGQSTQINGQRLLTAIQSGVDGFSAIVPPLPVLPGPAHYSYQSSAFNLGQGDYFTPPYEQTAVVVNRPAGLSFTAEAIRPGLGTVIEKTDSGVIGVDREQSYLQQTGFFQTNKTPNTTRITALAPGNFTTGASGERFFAGSRWGLNGADYAVATPGTAIVPPYTFPRPVTNYTEFHEGSVTDAVVADFNGDGKSDAALVIEGQLLVRLTGATPLSELRSSTALGFQATQIGKGDFNGDQRIDLVVGGPGGVQIFLGDGNGNFASRPLVSATAVTNHLNVGDIDGDQNLDVTYMNSQGFGNRNWVVAFGDGQGGLGRVRTGTTGFRIAASELADMNGDGRADLVTVQSKSQRLLATDADVSVSIHPGGPEGFLPQQVIQVSSGYSGADLVLRDVNGDGRTDITLAITARSSSGVLGHDIYNRTSSLLNLLRQP